MLHVFVFFGIFSSVWPAVFSFFYDEMLSTIYSMNDIAN